LWIGFGITKKHIGFEPKAKPLGHYDYKTKKLLSEQYLKKYLSYQVRTWFVDWSTRTMHNSEKSTRWGIGKLSSNLGYLVSTWDDNICRSSSKKYLTMAEYGAPTLFSEKFDFRGIFG
jgi:hypothetical protein